MSSAGVVLDDRHLRKLQLEMLDLLVEFDRVCRKNNITYYLSCGTLLGAIRHKGFIPWDNDADVELPREEYEKFCQVCDRDMDSERFFFQNSDNDEHYFWPFGKLRRRNTRFVRPGQEHLKQKDGICIDVFVLDNMPGKGLTQFYMEMVTTLCRKILYAPVGALHAKTFAERLAFRLLSCIQRRTALRLHKKVATMFRDKKAEWYGFFNTKFREERGFGLRKLCYAEALDWEFEGHMFKVPCGFDEILHYKYADYMELPPESKRTGSSSMAYIRFSDGEELRADSAK